MQKTNQMAKQTLNIKLAAFIVLFLLMVSLVLLQLKSGNQSKNWALTTEDSVQWVEIKPAQVSVNWNSGATPTPTPTTSTAARMTSGTNMGSILDSALVTEPEATEQP